MSDPIPSTSDLGTYLGITAIDATRASQIIGYAVSLCQSVVTPLPAGASAVVISVAARAWANPLNAQGDTTGPSAVNWGTVSGGLWLTRQDIATLRRLNGGSSAFTIDVMPTGTASVQTVTVVGAPATGSFTLATGYGTTVSLDIAATTAVVQAAFNALPGLSGVLVSGVPGAWILTIPATYGPFPQITVASQTFTGGTSPAVLNGTLTTGAYPPGYGLPWWDSGAVPQSAIDFDSPTLSP